MSKSIRQLEEEIYEVEKVIFQNTTPKIYYHHHMVRADMPDYNSIFFDSIINPETGEVYT